MNWYFMKLCNPLGCPLNIVQTLLATLATWDGHLLGSQTSDAFRRTCPANQTQERSIWRHETTCRKLLRQDKGGKATEIYKALRTETWRKKNNLVTGSTDLEELPFSQKGWWLVVSFTEWCRLFFKTWNLGKTMVGAAVEPESITVCSCAFWIYALNIFLGWKTIWIQLDF